MRKFNMAGLRGMLEQMPTEQLDELLQIELEKEQLDETAVRMIMSILEERDQETPVEINENIEAAWEKYQAYDPVKEQSRFPLQNWPLRVVAAVAVVVLLFASMPQDADAEGFWERFARWTDSVFEFFSSDDTAHNCIEYVFETDNPELQQVYDTVVGLGITEPVVPMWLPDGYELIECKINQSDSKIFIYACFANDSGNIVLDITKHRIEAARQYSKDKTNTRTYEKAGQTHNILRNEKWWTAVWIKDELECAIYTDCQEETLYQILESIYVMEDN